MPSRPPLRGRGVVSRSGASAWRRAGLESKRWMRRAARQVARHTERLRLARCALPHPALGALQECRAGWALVRISRCCICAAFAPAPCAPAPCALLHVILCISRVRPWRPDRPAGLRAACVLPPKACCEAPKASHRHYTRLWSAQRRAAAAAAAAQAAAALWALRSTPGISLCCFYGISLCCLCLCLCFCYLCQLQYAAACAAACAATYAASAHSWDAWGLRFRRHAHHALHAPGCVGLEVRSERPSVTGRP
jgi:hypothetical protein